MEGALDFVVLPTTQASIQNNKALRESLSAHWNKLNKKAASRTIDTGSPTKDTR